jgi:hypothetical protein
MQALHSRRQKRSLGEALLYIQRPFLLQQECCSAQIILKALRTSRRAADGTAVLTCGVLQGGFGKEGSACSS